MEQVNTLLQNQHFTFEEESQIERNVTQELISSSYAHLRTASIVSLFGAFVPLIGLQGKVADINLWGWFLTMILIHSFNIWHFYYYRKHHAEKDNPFYWQNLLRAGVIMSTFSWGIMGFMLVPLANPLGQNFILVFLIFVSSSIALGTSTDLIAAILGISTALVPHIGWQFIHGLADDKNLHLEISLVMFLYMLFLMGVSYTGYRSSKKAINLSQVNVALSAKLAHANRELKNINNDLEQRVDEKTRELAHTLDIVKHQASHDLLTDLPNQLSFNEFISQVISENKNINLAIFYVGLDNFKNINDSLTHTVGNHLLKSVASRLQEEFPKIINNDKNNHSFIIARMMGDCFAIAVLNIPNEEETLSILSKNILMIISQPFTLDISEENNPNNIAEKKEFRITASIGVSHYPTPTHGIDENTLLMNAETAMYHAKEAGKNRMMIYRSSMNVNTLDQLRLLNDLRQAVKKGELVQYYQPQVDLRTLEIAGVETLLRWQHPIRGLLYPDKFIKMAESDYELMAEIDAWVIEAGIRQAKIWQEQGYPPIKIAVNLSFKQINETTNNIINTIQFLLEKYNFPAHCLEIEITESVACKDIKMAISLLTGLKQLGILLSLDDFGTGYSGLNYIEQLPFDLVKIDRSFILNLPTSSKTLQTVKSIIELARNLKLKVLAEGVEFKEEIEIVLQLDCDYLQGYYFSRPITAEQMTKLLKEKTLLKLPES